MKKLTYHQDLLNPLMKKEIKAVYLLLRNAGYNIPAGAAFKIAKDLDHYNIPYDILCDICYSNFLSTYQKTSYSTILK